MQLVRRTPSRADPSCQRSNQKSDKLAGGSGRTKKRRARKRREREDEELFGFSGVNDGASGEDGTQTKWKGKGKARQVDDEPEPMVTRAAKRRKFVNDLQYLSGQEEELPGPSAVSCRAFSIVIIDA